MPKISLNDIISEEGHGREYASSTVKLVRDNITRALAAGTDVSITGLGIFHVVDRAARVVKNPYTGEPINVPARRGVIFRPAAGLKRTLNGDEEAD